MSSLGAPPLRGELIDQTDGRYAGYDLEGIDHASLHGGHVFAGVSPHAEIGIEHHCVLRIEAPVAVHRLQQTAHCNKGRCDQDGADGNLQDEQHISEGEAAAGIAGDDSSGSGLDHLIGVGAQDLADRDHAEEESAGEGKQKCGPIDGCIGRDRHNDGIAGNWMPDAERAEQCDAAKEAKRAAGDGNEQGFGKDGAQNTAAAGAEGKTECNFAGPVGSAGGKETSEVGAGGQQNQARENESAATNPFTGGPSRSPARLGRARANVMCASVLG